MTERDQELAVARRALEKAESTLLSCEQYFTRQAEANAVKHLYARVIYPPIHAAITRNLRDIRNFREVYPFTPESQFQ